jgi:DNA-binding NarL/FixJ family response regulator
MCIRILIAEDDELIRKAFVLLVQTFEGVEVSGEAANGVEAVKMALKLKPDVILIDLIMPEMDGIQAAKNIKAILPDIRIIALTVVEKGPEITEGLSAGIDGYILKKASPQELDAAIKTVAEGKRYICPQIAGYIADAYLSEQKIKESPFNKVTPREMEVLELVCKGKRAKEISTILKISVKTAEKHRDNLRHKLGVDTTAELVTAYMKHKSGSL